MSKILLKQPKDGKYVEYDTGQLPTTLNGSGL